MKTAIAAMLAAAAGLLAANMLGVASAEAPTTTPSVRTVTVEGVGKTSIAQAANSSVATESYRQAMASAVADGLGKAEFLAGKTGVALGAVQSVVEDGGSISCTTGPEAEYLSYEGEQPDFPASSGSTVVAPLAVERSAKAVAPKSSKRRKTPKAKKATAGTCTLSAQVSLVYAIT